MSVVITCDEIPYTNISIQDARPFDPINDKAGYTYTHTSRIKYTSPGIHLGPSHTNAESKSSLIITDVRSVTLTHRSINLELAR